MSGDSVRKNITVADYTGGFLFFSVSAGLIEIVVFTPVSTIFGNWLAEGCAWNEYLVTALNMIANFVLEYLYDRFLVFGKSIDTNERAHTEK